jgi:hypothetical protein
MDVVAPQNEMFTYVGVTRQPVDFVRFDGVEPATALIIITIAALLDAPWHVQISLTVLITCLQRAPTMRITAANPALSPL